MCSSERIPVLGGTLLADRKETIAPLGSHNARGNSNTTAVANPQAPVATPNRTIGEEVANQRPTLRAIR
jgi:hypothetical protein